MFNPLRYTKLAHRLLILMLLIVIGIIAISASSLVETRAVLLEQKRLQTKHVVDTVYTLVEHYAGLANEGVLSEQEAQQAASSAIEKLRYNGSDYLWINDMQPRMIMHPNKPHRIGMDLSQIEDSNGTKIFIEIIDKVKADGAGFVDYLGPKPGQDLPAAKTSYVRGFIPWGWVIGSGTYIDEVNMVFMSQFKGLALIGLVVTVLIGLFCVFIARGITQTMGRAESVATGIVNGKFDNPIKVFTNDVTGRLFQALKTMQTSLREQIEKDHQAAAEMSRIKQALDNVSAGVMVVDANDNIIYLNKAIADMFSDAQGDICQVVPGFAANELLGSSAVELQQHAGRQDIVLANVATSTCAEFMLANHTFKITANPIIAEDGERLGTVVEWADRSAELAVEVEVQTIVERAKAGDLSRRIPLQNKEGFFGTLSNGINDLVDVSEDVINDTLRVFGAMASGALHETIDADYQGAYGQLKHDANATLVKLIDVIGQVKMGSEQISSGAEEISQGNANLSRRTEEQAASLEQTASSMEQMTATVKQNADNAAQANQLATTARAQAEIGGAVVSQAVSAMAEINRSSKKIADIIGVIDDIAFQTNLLALNAAVEAARAGDQGRGFAVVASEVRNLAQRSAGAAKEIKSLIVDSVEKVDSGSKLVDESGRTLADIVRSVKKVSDIIAEIAAAGQEQSIGIDKVNQAVLKMDSMTQQNAALVEQAAAASDSMSEQAHHMNAMMGFFQVDVATVLASNVPQQERRSTQRPWNSPQARANTSAITAPAPKQQASGSGDKEWDEF